MEPWRHFRFCPRCGHDQSSALQQPLLDCPACGFHFYFNCTVAVAGIVVADDGRVLLLRRAKEPSKGMLGMPGGFVDFGESSEDALRREAREEVNVELDRVEYLSSHPNTYHYQGVTYQTVDLFYLAHPRSVETVAALDDVEAICWMRPDEVRAEDLAFPSMTAAWKLWLANQRR